MVKVKVIKDFRLGRFNELKNIIRANLNKKEEGHLYVNDIFECTDDMAEYLIKNNTEKKAFITIIEVIPEKKEKTEDTEKKTTTRRRKRSVAKE